MIKIIYNTLILILSCVLSTQSAAASYDSIGGRANTLRPTASAKQEAISKAIIGDTRIITDTSSYKEIDIGNIIELEGRRYRIMQNMNVPAVKKARELTTGKIVWLKFQRDGLESAREAEVLNLLSKTPLDNFCQGRSFLDEKGNRVNVIGNIEGSALYDIVRNIAQEPEEYFIRHFIVFAEKLLIAAKAIEAFHKEFHQAHGDVHSGNIIIEENTGRPFWIDFQIEGDMMHLDIDGLVRTLLFLVLKPEGDSDVYEIGDFPDEEFAQWEISWDGDTIVNAKRLRGYIPDRLNNMFLKTSNARQGAYKNAHEFITDLENVIAKMRLDNTGQGSNPIPARHAALEGLFKQNKHDGAILNSV